MDAQLALMNVALLTAAVVDQSLVVASPAFIKHWLWEQVEQESGDIIPHLDIIIAISFSRLWGRDKTRILESKEASIPPLTPREALHDPFQAMGTV
jgi:hypothetical protein